MRVFSPSYFVTLAVTAIAAVGLCMGAHRRPGRWVIGINWLLAAALLVTSGAWLVTNLHDHQFSAASSLPFALCDIAALVAAAALISRQPLLVETTYFWGLAGTLQALVTPDLGASYPSLEFFEYVVGHGAIVCAALFLVVGQRLAPRPRAVPRIWLVTVGYSAFVGAIDAVTGGDYMYLRHPPSTKTLLSFLGPWPWYIVSAAGVAVVLFTLLDAPWWPGRRTEGSYPDRARTDGSHPATSAVGEPRASARPARSWGDATRRHGASIVPAGQTEARSDRTAGQGGVSEPPPQSGASWGPAPSTGNDRERM